MDGKAEGTAGPGGRWGEDHGSVAFIVQNAFCDAVQTSVTMEAADVPTDPAPASHVLL